MRATVSPGSSGRGVLRGLLDAAGAVAEALTPATWTPAARAAAARSLVEAAWPVLPGVVLACAVLGLVVIRIAVATARDYGLGAYALDIFLRVLVLELIPLFVALFVAVRSGAAIATEAALRRAGAWSGPGRPLLPAGVGVAAAVGVLTAAGSMTALVVGYAGLYGLSPWGHAPYARVVGQVFAPVVLAGLALKVTFFAVAVATVPALTGRAAARTLAAVPSAAPRGLVGLFATLALVEAGSLTLKYIG